MLLHVEDLTVQMMILVGAYLVLVEAPLWKSFSCRLEKTIVYTWDVDKHGRS